MDSIKEKFFEMENVSYLYTGAQGPVLKSSMLALTNYVTDKSLGDRGREKAEAVEQRVKANLAKMIGAKEKEIAFLGNASEGINSLIEALHIQPGENIILNDLEYASVYLPWTKRHQDENIEIRIVQSVNGRVNHADIAANIDDKGFLL